MDIEGNEFLEYLELQDSLDMVTKSELLEHVRRAGAKISDRQLTTYVTAGLVPRATRIGSRAGAYPRSVVDLVLAIARGRSAGLSLEAIRELIPVWKLLMRARRDRELDLSELETVVRDNVMSLEAAYAVAWVFQYWMPMLLLDDDLIPTELVFIDKRGDKHRHNSDNPISIGFVVAEQDERTGKVRRRNSMRVALPLADEGLLPTTIIAGIPNGVHLPPCRTRPRVRSSGEAASHGGEGDRVEHAGYSGPLARAWEAQAGKRSTGGGAET